VVLTRRATEAVLRPRARDLIGGVELPPYLQRAPERDQRVARPLLGEQRRAPGLGGNRSHSFAIEIGGGFIELATGGAREVETANGDHDLHVGRQRARPPQR